MDWIQGDKFIELADFVYAPAERHPDDYGKLVNTLDIKAGIWLNDHLKVKPPIVYTHTFYTRQLFDVLKHTHRNIILITHNSDLHATWSETWPNRIIKWYSTNVNYERDFIESIPIGIENDRWCAKSLKKEKMQNMLCTSKTTDGWLYLNHNVKTNPAAREGIYELFEGKKWATIERGLNGSGFDSYIDNIYHHIYTACPEGNGIDTHRIWECLYMGSFPVVKRNINNSFYEGILPILFVNDWKDITLELLVNNYTRLSVMDTEALSFEYWKTKIQSYGNK